MRILIVGSGGREHTLAWKIAQSPRVEKVFVSPGNDGLADVAEPVAIKAGGIEDLADWTEKNRIDFTVVGPEVPLALGIADAFAKRGLPLFGPSRAAARLEASKVFAKELMAKYGIPTAPFRVFDKAEATKEYIRSRQKLPVIKADGLAAGKGVILPATVAEAEAAIHQLMEEKIYGDAGNRVVLEERLAGEEVSLLAVTDGKTILPLLAAQDHKRIDEGDQGPNTGGMGAYAPASVLTPELLATTTTRILEPVIQAMNKEGHPYTGVLYAGLMLTKNGPEVVEFNVRFGDPETQVILPLLQTDLVEVISAVLAGRLAEISLSWRPGAAACVVLASGGYPGSYQTGYEITGLEEAAKLGDLLVFHAGTERKDGIWRTSGGRVLNLVGVGATLPEALAKAYHGAELIRFPGCHYRRDIGWRELRRLQAGAQ